MGEGRVERTQVRRLLSVVAIGFGLVTAAAGGSVLVGRDPGYVVYRPLVIFNSLMGLVYCGTGIVAWRSLLRGRILAGAVLALNLAALAAVIFVALVGGAVALDSVRAMVFRSVVWLALFLSYWWLARAGQVR
ncbi:MAG: hypothetical protein MNPFHGCM_03236 [Gemmatimonadaceae bacterium]|nr:hypothetical protein [Gemmatimonadaceae bacterium]